jgi:hypothetical protein
VFRNGVGGSRDRLRSLEVEGWGFLAHGLGCDCTLLGNPSSRRRGGCDF